MQHEKKTLNDLNQTFYTLSIYVSYFKSSRAGKQDLATVLPPTLLLLMSKQDTVDLELDSVLWEEKEKDFSLGFKILL